LEGLREQETDTAREEREKKRRRREERWMDVFVRRRKMCE